MREDWSDFDNPPPLGGRRVRGSRGRGGRRPAPEVAAHQSGRHDEDLRHSLHDDHDGAHRARSDHRRGHDHDGDPAPVRRRRPAEEQVYLGHPHWRSMIGFYLRGLAVVLLAGALLYLGNRAGAVPMVAVVGGTLALALGVFWLAALVRRTTVYRITTRRVSKRWGIVMKYAEEAPLRRIQNVTVGQSIPERLLGIGTVDFDTAGEREDQDLLSFRGVRSPWAVKGLVPYDDEDDYL